MEHILILDIDLLTMKKSSLISRKEYWLLLFRHLLFGKYIFPGTKDTNNRVIATFEEHSLVLDKEYRHLY